MQPFNSEDQRTKSSVYVWYQKQTQQYPAYETVYFGACNYLFVTDINSLNFLLGCTWLPLYVYLTFQLPAHLLTKIYHLELFQHYTYIHGYLFFYNTKILNHLIAVKRVLVHKMPEIHIQSHSIALQQHRAFPIK